MFEKIIIEPQEVRTTSRKFGERTVHEQTAYAQFANEKYPVKIKFTVPADVLKDNPASDNMDGYAAGEYYVDGKSFRVGKYNKLELNPFELTLNKLAQPLDLKKSA